jgi:glycosyltransferase involved in cell wall biosynthesis
MKYLTLAEKNVCKRADLIIAIARCVKEDICSNYRIDTNKIVVNYHGLPNGFSNGFKVSFPDLPVYLHIATDHQRKGTKYLLQAMSILQKKYGVAGRVVLVGKKDPYYMDLARKLDVRADFVGKVSEAELKALYASCTCLVVPSIREGFCIPVIEANSFGKPAIVTRAGALSELVEDGEDGFVVPVADVESLAEKMYLMATNVPLRDKMALSAEEKVKDFGIDMTAKRLINALEILKEEGYS